MGRGDRAVTVILLGMGGSSLGPAVLEAVRAAGTAGPSGRRLVVCDTTDPTTVGALDFSDAFVLVSSKSGTTLEPNVLFAHAWSASCPTPSRFAAITDPGTPLAALGRERGFHRVFENQPDIGGRYSVLSYFGMVPAALIGYDVGELCERALEADPTEAVELGLAMGEAAKAGRDKVTIVVPEAFALLRPVGRAADRRVDRQARHRLRPGADDRARDRARTATWWRSTLDRAARSGASSSTAWSSPSRSPATCSGSTPSTSPTWPSPRRTRTRCSAHLPLPDLEAVAPGEALGLAELDRRPGDYVSLQAYLPFGQDAALEALRRRVRDHQGGMAVTAGYGPRFLHSTGQLHKGGPNSVVAVQLVRRAARSPSSRSRASPTTSARSSARRRSATTRACSPTGGACCGWPSTTSARSV